MNNSEFPLPGQNGTNSVPMQGQANNGGTVMMATPAMGGVLATAPIAPAEPIESDGDKIRSLVKTIAIVVLSLISVTFIGLFIWMTVQYNEVSEDVNGQIDQAVAEAVYENSLKLENDFAEREKDPYRMFTGPADYGQLSFKYPKTWSVYVAADASKGGDFEAYFNPIEVETVSRDTINALRLTIEDDAFETVAEYYQRILNRSDSGLSVEAITVSGTAANLYTGKIPDTDLEGYIVIFKIRDKTAIFQTDSVLFKEDFDRILSTVTFNA